MTIKCCQTSDSVLALSVCFAACSDCNGYVDMTRSGI